MKISKMIGVAGALALSALPSVASAADSMRVNVPFAFVVAGQQFAPGEYVITESGSGVILVQGAGKGAMVLSAPSAPPTAKGSSGLRFTNTAQQFHLTSVEQQGLETRSIPVHVMDQRTLTMSSR